MGVRPVSIEFVNVDTETFSATVPAVGSLRARDLIKIVAETNPGIQFSLMVEEFRNTLTDERRSEFDALTLENWAEIVTKWIEVSPSTIGNQETKNSKKKWWTFW